MAKHNGKAPARRFDCVFIRKSTDAQDEKGQTKNVQKMLDQLGIVVPEEHWFVCTVPRAKVKANVDFKRLIDLVEADRVATIFIESQDRFGSGNNKELFTLLGILENHDCKLFDLRDGCDLTASDEGTEIKVLLSGFKSKKERSDLSYRSLRTKVANFQTTGTWPSGVHPFGFGKRCYTEAGELLWEWQPISRTKGRVYRPAANGKLIPGLTIERIPAKAKGERQRTVLVPSNNKEHVKTVQLIFDWFTRLGLARRGISKKLNDEGRRFYDKPFTHSLVQNIIDNEAYVGHTVFGKTQGGSFNTFDGNGVVVKLEKPMAERHRRRDQRLIKKNTHKGLVSRAVWDMAQQKLTADRKRPSFAPMNPAYYLKQLFVCGHCGKGMCGRTERNPTTKVEKVIYCCSDYVQGKSSGRKVGCGYHRISHAEAEQMLLDKIKEFGLEQEEARSKPGDDNLQGQLVKLYDADVADRERWHDWLEAGVGALIGYVRDEMGVKGPALKRLETLAAHFYRWGRVRPRQFEGMPIELKEFKKAIEAAEAADVKLAKETLEQLDAKHRQMTERWAMATAEQQRQLKQICDQLEDEMRAWRPRCERLSERFAKMYAADSARQTERERLRDELPTMDAREKGEALRRFFERVTLYWEPTFRPAAANPTRPHKTERAGRYSYKLLKDKITWALASSGAASSS